MNHIPSQAILQHLKLELYQPNKAFLDQILKAWSRYIPWESASRIARHRKPEDSPAHYARFPADFFTNALQYGTGGTCFETNLALHHFLRDLGFSSTLHFCDMEGSISNPHCALIVTVEDTAYLADAGYPVPAALPLIPDQNTQIETTVYQFVAEAQGQNTWQIWRKAAAYEAKAFAIKAEVISESDFRMRLIQDHEPDGLFLDNVIISRTNDEDMLRYSQDRGLVRRRFQAEEFLPLSEVEQADLPATLARLFHFDEGLLREALGDT